MGTYEANTNLTSKIVHIRSEDGTPSIEATENNLTTAFMIALEESINCGTHQSIVVSLNSCEFPMSFYGLNERNSTLNWYEGISPLLTLNIAYGNYNAYQLANYLSINMTAVSASTGLSWVWSVTYDIITNKFTFSQTGGTWIFDFTNSDSPNIQLGYEPISYTLGVSPLFTSTSPNCININGTDQALYVRTQMTSISAIESISKQYSDILQKVPISAPPNAILYFIPGTGSGVPSLLQTKNIPVINVRITDDQNRLINTNGLNFTLSIQFDFIKTPEITIPSIVRRMDRIQEQHTSLMIKKYRRIKQKKNAQTKQEKDIIDAEEKGDEKQMANLMESMDLNKKALMNTQPAPEIQNLGSARVLNERSQDRDFTR
jgi:hypothetical protein